MKNRVKNKVKYEFYIDSGVPYIRSDLISCDLDMLQLVSADTGNEKLIRECIEHIITKRIWWVNSSRMEYKGDKVIITPAFDWQASVTVKKTELLCILRKFQEFLKRTNEPKKIS